MRSSRAVFSGKIVHDFAAEQFRLVHEIVGDAQLVRDGARVGDGLRTAAFFLFGRHAVLFPAAKGDADDVVAVALQQIRRHAGIHAAAHRDDHSGFAVHCLGANIGKPTAK
jgi:hypothetical protein